MARGAILRFIRSRHQAQKHRMDHVQLWHMLRGVGFDLGEFEVMTYLQDLHVLDCVTFEEDRDEQLRRLTLVKIQLCARGLGIIEGRIKEPSVII